MFRRGASPAPSEPELDILDSLYTEDTGHPQPTPNAEDALAIDEILNIPSSYNDGEDEAFIASQQAASYRRATNLKGRTVKKGGGFQAMGINANLLKAITRKGFSVPTPIQRKTIPLVLDARDVVGMARTGSGKTAAFVIPMVEKLRVHSATFGSRALILSPSRELAIQTLKVVKELSRGTDLRSVLLVGGDSLEEQFGTMTANPDIVIATPGRFLHLKVEMRLELSSIKYVVFDEADRLFEMGFATQLTEILHALPPLRQTLLFSATLPASLVEFARAGLQNPSLVRLDAETKVSPDLQNAFFSVKGAEKEGCLLNILHDIIGIPVGPTESARREAEKGSKKRKRGFDIPGGKPTDYSTIIFTATKHHVEYLASFLGHAGFATSYAYGSLDQTARRIQVEDFRRGKTYILVVTDVAARGIDIPVLANVINYDFPPQPKIFVHRVGRTARAGQKGWSYSLVRDIDAPYLLDLQLFLGKKLVGQEASHVSFSADVVIGSLKRDQVEQYVEWTNKVLDEAEDISSLRKVAGKAERLYLKTRHSASAQSVKRARELMASIRWMQLHQLFGKDEDNSQQARASMLAKISNFKPQETIFEIGHADKTTAEAAAVMKEFRRKKPLRKRQETTFADLDSSSVPRNMPEEGREESENGSVVAANDLSYDQAEDDGLEVTISNTGGKTREKSDWQDPELFMSYTPRTFNTTDELGYGVHSGGKGSTFVEAARDATMDLTNDESAKAFGMPTQQKMRWDTKSRKYVSRDNDEDGSKGSRTIVGESGVRIAASFQSGRFDKWKRAQRIAHAPRVGEAERPGALRGLPSGKRFKHTQKKAPKEADKFRDDFEVRKKRVQEAREKRIGRFKDGMGDKRELKNMDEIRKARAEKEKRRLKNARRPKK